MSFIRSPLDPQMCIRDRAYAAAEVRIMTGFCRQHILRQEREG